MMERLIPNIAGAGFEIAARIIQTIGVLALVVVTYGDKVMTLFALVIALIWVDLPRRDLLEKARELLIKRDLFHTLGEWLDQPDGGKKVDEAYEKHLDLEAGGESAELNAVAKAQAFGGLWMGVVSVLLQVYLLVVAVQVLADAAGG